MTENSQNWPDLKTGEEDITNSQILASEMYTLNLFLMALFVLQLSIRQKTMKASCLQHVLQK